MQVNDIQPFARYVRYLRIGTDSVFCRNIPLDARLFYAIEGEGIIEIGGQPLVLKPGSVLYIPSGVPYHIHGGNVVYLAVNFDFTQSHSDLTVPVEPVPAQGQQPELVEKAEFTDVVCFNGYFLCHEQYELRLELEALESAYAQKLPYYQQETSGRLTAVLTCMARQAGKRMSRGNRFQMEEMMDYIRAHLHENIDNNTLAKQFHFHPNYISAEFKNAVGQPLHSFVLEVRILHAISLIEAGQRDISKIAQSCGFSSTNYFTRYFKKRMGVTPGAYIRRQK